MNKTKILFTGGSSFTGLWFVKFLNKGGYDVYSTLTKKNIDCYEGIRKDRVLKLKNYSKLFFDCEFGNKKFISILDKKWDVLCHHGAEVSNYKSLDFDIVNAISKNSHN